jgi:type I restriction enzyme S subunit
MKFEDESLYRISTQYDGIPISLFELAVWKNGLAFRSIDFSDIGLPVIKITELNNGISESTRYTNVQYSKEFFLTKGDMVFAWSGNPDTSIDVYRYDLPDGWLNQHIFKITPNQQLVEKDYLFYLLKYLKSRFKKIAQNKQTTGLGHITIADLKKIMLVLPQKELQIKIGRILRSLDDKIESNKRANDILQQQAQALFKAWFLDNNERVDWEIGHFSDYIETVRSGDWGKELPNSAYTEQVYCIRGADIPDIKCGNKGKMPTRYIQSKNLLSKKLSDGDIVVEISGGSPTQSTGRIAQIHNALIDRYNGDMICTNFCKAITPKPNASAFIYYYWQYLYDKGVFFAYENGTTGIKNLDVAGIIETEQIILPPKPLIEQFDIVCRIFVNQIATNGLESERLATLRDTLLPKLMSGEIDVSDVEI